MNINRIEQLLKENGLKVYDVNISNYYCNNSFRFYTIESYFDFLKELNIKYVFYEKVYLNKFDYIIDDAYLKNKIESYSMNLQNEIVNKVKEYNEEILTSNLNMIVEIKLVATQDNRNFYYGEKIEEIYLNDRKLNSKYEALSLILSDFKDEIDNENNAKKSLLQEQINKAELFVLNDREFVFCTTKVLRKNYITNLLQNRLGDEFENLKSKWLNPASRKEVYQDAIDFIELVWRKKSRR